MKKILISSLIIIFLSSCSEDLAKKLEEQNIALPDTLKYVEISEGFKPLYDELSYSSYQERDLKILQVTEPTTPINWYFQLEDIETGVNVFYVDKINCGKLNAKMGDIITLDIKLQDYPVDTNKETNRMRAGVHLAGFERHCNSNNSGYLTDM